MHVIESGLAMTLLMVQCCLSWFLLMAVAKVCRVSELSRQDYLAWLPVGLFATYFVLYFALLIFPGFPQYFYLALFLALLGFSGALAFKSWDLHVLTAFKRGLLRDWKLICIGVGALILFGLGITRYLGPSLSGHDILVYSVLGKVIARERSIVWLFHGIDALTGFRYMPAHAPVVPILYFWGDAVSGQRIVGEYFVRILTPVYGLSLLIFVGLQIRQYRWFVGLAAVVALFSGDFVGRILFVPHIDSLRLFLVLMSLWYFWRSLERGASSFVRVSFGIFAGMSAAFHVIGALVTCAEIFGFYFWHRQAGGRIEAWEMRIIVGTVIILGLTHYMIRYGFMVIA